MKEWERREAGREGGRRRRRVGKGDEVCVCVGCGCGRQRERERERERGKEREGERERERESNLSFMPGAVLTDHVGEVCPSHSNNDYGERQLGGSHNAVHCATHVRYDTILQIQYRITDTHSASD